MTLTLTALPVAGGILVMLLAWGDALTRRERQDE